MFWEQLLLLAVLVLIGVVTYSTRMMSAQYQTSFREEFTGVCTTTIDRTIKRQGNLDKIIALLQERGNVQNHDIRQELNVSSRTVVRYMDELERDGVVTQVGDVGQAVTYRLHN